MSAQYTKQEREAVMERLRRMSTADLLKHNRFDPIGDPFWQDEHGILAMAELKARAADGAEWTRASKQVGWTA